MATLFQPELTASTGQPHPLIRAFLTAASVRAAHPAIEREATTSTV
ncbi:hypothetical protein JGU66_35020 [Myxococcaceae bacterium JPH2]|nr:hypothetical protein [Myxococcaceae bacterium JPH2]